MSNTPVVNQPVSERAEDRIADPTRHYAKPMDVVNDPTLEPDAKRQILESWKTDAQLLSTAQDENMTGGEAPGLQDVSIALEKLERISGSKN
ncbi:MAG TPA: hypothetical protein VGN07_05045 [Steroidobacteraceae bacterium]|jgi:hypothetical protein